MMEHFKNVKNITFFRSVDNLKNMKFQSVTFDEIDFEKEIKELKNIKFESQEYSFLNCTFGKLDLRELLPENLNDVILTL